MTDDTGTSARAFVSKDLEFLFLESAPSHEVIRYIDSMWMHMHPGIGQAAWDWTGFRFQCPEPLEEMLLARDDRFVDVALARICSKTTVLRLLERYAAEKPAQPYEAGVIESEFRSRYDYWQALQARDLRHSYYDRLVLSALSNRVSLSNMLGPATWLSQTWEWLLVYGRTAHFEALYSNPDCPRDLLDKVLKDDYVCGFEDRRVALLRAALSSPLLPMSPRDENDYDLAGHTTIKLFWTFVRRCNGGDSPKVGALYANKTNFPKLEFRDEVFDLPKHGQPGYNHVSNARKAVSLLFDQFDVTDEEEQKRNGVYFAKQDICCAIAQSYIREFFYDKDAKAFLAAHRNQGVRRGLYEGGSFKDNDADLCRKFLQLDGFSFCRSAMANPSFYDRTNNPALVQWFIRTIATGLGPEHYKEDYEGGPILEWYVAKATKHFQERPKLYIDPNFVQRIADEEEDLAKPDRKSFFR